MRHPRVRPLVAVLACLAPGSGHAFQWTAIAFRPGGQGYTIQMATCGGVTVIGAGVVDRGGRNEVTTALTVAQESLVADDLGVALSSGSARSPWTARRSSPDTRASSCAWSSMAATPSSSR